MGMKTRKFGVVKKKGGGMKTHKFGIELLDFRVHDKGRDQ